MNELIKLENRISDLWASIFAISISLWFPLFYDLLIYKLHIPQLLTGLAGSVFLCVYMLVSLSFWCVLMFKVIKLIRKKRKLFG